MAFVLVRVNREKLNPFWSLPALFIVTATSILIFRCIVATMHPVGDWASVLIYTHFRIDSLLFGVLLSYLYSFQPGLLERITRRFHGQLFAFAVCTVSIPVLFPIYESRVSYTIGFTLLYLGFGAILLITLFSTSRLKGALVRITAPLLVPIGQSSYSIYLWHMAAYFISVMLFPMHDTTNAFLYQVAAYLLGSTMIGLLMFRLIELPSLALREKYFSIRREKGSGIDNGTGMWGVWSKSRDRSPTPFFRHRT